VHLLGDSMMNDVVALFLRDCFIADALRRYYIKRGMKNLLSTLQIFSVTLCSYAPLASRSLGAGFI